MEPNVLANRIVDIRQRVVESVKNATLDQYQEKAFAFILERLDAMEAECRTGSFRPVAQRYPELGRIAVETDPKVLPPDIGGELIDIEKIYQVM